MMMHGLTNFTNKLDAFVLKSIAQIFSVW
jgi:hypothetical protein